MWTDRGTQAVGFVADGVGVVKAGVWAAKAIQGGLRGTRGLGSALRSACSFTAATPVLMADGTTKPIEDVKVGDKVQATDPDTGVIAAEEVTQTHLNDDHNLLDLTITTPTGTGTGTGTGTKTIHTTDNHPFYDDTTNTWTPAGQLTPGHHLRTTTNTPATITTLTPVPGHAWMHNLTIDRLHTLRCPVPSGLWTQ